MGADLNMAMQVLGYFEWSSKVNPPAVDVPGDSGGLTKYGIAAASHPGVDIANLTLEQATDIYGKEYWDVYLCGEIDNQCIATQLFLGVVNTSHHSVVMCLQSAIHNNLSVDQLAAGNNIDGQMGPLTVQACNELSDSQQASVVTSFSSLLSAHYKALNEPKFLNGWLTRAAWPWMYVAAWPHIDTHWRPL